MVAVNIEDIVIEGVIFITGNLKINFCFCMMTGGKLCGVRKFGDNER